MVNTTSFITGICLEGQDPAKLAFTDTAGKATLLPSSTSVSPTVKVTFEIDENGILNVTARDQATGNEKSITITAATKMTESEIEEATREAEENEAENIRRAKLAETRNEADSQIISAQNLIDDPDVKSQLDSSAVENIAALIAELLELKESEDERSIKLKTDELRNAVADASSGL